MSFPSMIDVTRVDAGRPREDLALLNRAAVREQRVLVASNSTTARDAGRD